MKRITKIFAVILVLTALAGCGSGSSGGTNPPPPSSATMNLVLSDTPSTKITVLSFQIQITGAVLQPGNVSLLPRPVTVDLAQLVTDTSFLSSTVIGSDTFTSLTMTFANPQVTVVNNTGAPIVTPTQTCADGAVCTFTPRLNTASVTIASGVFPITVTANSSTGLALDLSIPDLLQSDLSITFANGSAVNLTLLPAPKSDGTQAQIDDILGVVQSVASGQVTIKTALGETLVLTTNSNTQYNFPQSLCTANNSTCLATNQIISADLSLLSGGNLQADTITYADSSGTTMAQGIIVALGSGATPTFEMLVHKVISGTGTFTPGEVVDVTVQDGAAFSVSAPQYPAVSGGAFAIPSDLIVGQEVLVEVGGALTSSDSHPAFSTTLLQLQSTQIAGQVTSVNSGAQSFALTNIWSLLAAANPAVTQLQVQTGAATSFVNLTPADISAIVGGKNLSVKGPLFHTTGGTGQPTMGALQVAARP
jgi:hypothetical protein